MTREKNLDPSTREQAAQAGNVPRHGRGVGDGAS